MGDVYRNIAEKMPSMSKAQEKIAKYILAHPNSAPFLTVEKLAKLAGVSIATVTRFVIFLGYKGYPEFLRDTQESMQQQVNNSERLRIVRGDKSREEDSVYDIFNEDLNNIRQTMNSLNMHELRKSVNMLINAKRIYIISRRSSSSLGKLLKYYLDLMFNDVYLIDSIDQMPKQIKRFTGEDVIIGLSFEKYSRSTVEIFTYLKRKGASTIAITDGMLSPLIPYADVTLTAVTKGDNLIESFAGPISLINVLITSIEKEKAESFNTNIEMMDEVWEKLDLFI